MPLELDLTLIFSCVLFCLIFLSVASCLERIKRRNRAAVVSREEDLEASTSSRTEPIFHHDFNLPADDPPSYDSIFGTENTVPAMNSCEPPSYNSIFMTENTVPAMYPCEPPSYDSIFATENTVPAMCPCEPPSYHSIFMTDNASPSV
ncbi:Oidioi.mRNA.OKI2018_I69.XSR.g15098.t1.cds [Oikopleura dioica]|uniref:Oidioi.mRNA.OKI2018_I69.XSR.g15098.t1.cds n=1 Tax=Oikopleura dioica TaxID=34765 RepID=A0ABN7SBS1_OIKDI|nr:Oidioi.mRNA.OKI2018_I69.XSR.g15098.t1.cds [Oikopleura dioica]